MPWAPTPKEVQDTLNCSVEGTVINTAQTMIEDELGRTEEAASGNIKPGGKVERIIRRAIGYQAVYLDANPGLLSGLDLASFSQPDFSATLKNGPAGAHLISPAAKRALRHLPGAGPRSVLAESWTSDPDRTGGDNDNDAADREWQPIN